MGLKDFTEDSGGEEQSSLVGIVIQKSKYIRLVPCDSLENFELVTAWHQENNNPAISIMIEELRKEK